MSYSYKIYDQHQMHFITVTVNQWVNVFTRKKYIDIIIDSLEFCQKEKQLKIFSWVIMSNHIHLIVRSDENKLSDIIRDFKKFTAKKIIIAITNNEREHRKNWMLWLLKKGNKICFWQNGYHGEEINSIDFFEVKLNYIHMNPVSAQIVSQPENYIYSSSADYKGVGKNLIQLDFVN